MKFGGVTKVERLEMIQVEGKNMKTNEDIQWNVNGRFW